jgi:CHAD domain-containing protein
MAKSKEIAGLDCEASASVGIRLVLRSRLEEMFAFREAALDWSDPEGVHDMRVASRRLRGAIRDFSPYLRKRRLQYPQDDLKSLADALGAVRDQDVAIMALEKLSSEAPPEVSAGVEELTNDRRLERDHARSELEEALAENASNELQERLNTAFERALKASRRRKSKGLDQTLAESVSFRQVGCDILAARLEELQAASTSFYRPLKIRPLHEMRLVAKRLRYASELFAPCWIEPLAPFCKEIAKLQTSLGELHDCDVWIANLGLVLRDVERESEGAHAQKRSAGFWLLGYFLSERADHFRSALRRWEEWERTGFLTSLTEIVDDKPLAEYAQRPGN